MPTLRTAGAVDGWIMGARIFDDIPATWKLNNHTSDEVLESEMNGTVKIFFKQGAAQICDVRLCGIHAVRFGGSARNRRSSSRERIQIRAGHQGQVECTAINPTGQATLTRSFRL